MIFSRKYVFETKKTKAIRIILNSLAAFCLVLILYATFLVFIVVTAKTENDRTAEGFFQKAPDAIIVFTGDKGRIKKALELMKKWPEAKMLISGVHGANTLKTIMAGHADAEALLASPLQVDIDYEALDTLGNVRETLQHLDSSQEKVSRVLVVTSDYHVLRVRMIFREQLGSRPYFIFYNGVMSDWSELANLKKLLLESVKFVRIWFLLLFA
ncbi:MAG: YdcF family protein [Bacteriovoracaceae bacterium]|nr:YdcF family protein [Bacteriovoracaceae bacterium]